MLKNSFYLGVCLVILCGPVSAFNDIDKFIRDHCASDCNGESPNCQDCYNEAVDLHDNGYNGGPVSPEVNFGLKNGKIEFSF